MNEAPLRNLTSPDRASFPFVEPFARFSLGYAESGQLGWGALHPRSVLTTYQVSNPTLLLWLVTSEGWRAVKRRSMEVLPWLVTEEGSVGHLQFNTESVFEDLDAALIRFTVENRGKEAARVQPAWSGVVRPEADVGFLSMFEGAPVVGRLAKRTASGPQVRASLDAVATGSPLAPVHWCVEALSAGVAAREAAGPPWAPEGGPILSPAPLWYAFEAPAFELQPGQSREWIFRLRVSAGQALEELTASEVRAWSKMVKAAKARFEQAAGPLPTGEPDSELRLRARLGLLRDGLEGSGRFEGQQVSLCTADASDFSCVFFWDSLFTSVAIAPWNRRYAQDVARSVFTDQDERDGSAGERHWDHGVPQRLVTQSPQMPVASWAVVEQFKIQEDKAFVRELWPKLVANHKFWETFSDADRDGLAEIRWTGQYCDNSPLWDNVASGSTAQGCQWVPPIASVAVNSFLYRDAGHLAQLARTLDLPAEVNLWQQRQTRLVLALSDVCFVPGEHRFWDYNHATRQHRRVKIFWMFWPLWAGIPLDAATTKSLLDALVDPKQFFGAVPFPSVAYDEPTHDPRGYWRGRSWPHVATWLCETLWRYGRRDEAEEAVKRLLTWYSASDGLRENLSSDASLVHPGGFPDYNWGCAAVELLASGRWKDLRP